MDFFYSDFFLLPTVWKLCLISKKRNNWVRNYILYKTDAKNALREKKDLNPKFDYTCMIYFSIVASICFVEICLVQAMLPEGFPFHQFNGCSVICKTSRIIAKILFFRLFCIFFALHDMKVFLFKTCNDLI